MNLYISLLNILNERISCNLICLVPWSVLNSFNSPEKQVRLTLLHIHEVVLCTLLTWLLVIFGYFRSSNKGTRFETNKDITLKFNTVVSYMRSQWNSCLYTCSLKKIFSGETDLLMDDFLTLSWPWKWYFQERPSLVMYTFMYAFVSAN